MKKLKSKPVLGPFAKISGVFAAHRSACQNRPRVFDNNLGCRNCGDMGTTFRTLFTLEDAMADALKLTGSARQKFLADCRVAWY